MVKESLKQYLKTFNQLKMVQSVKSVLGFENEQWLRIVMNAKTKELIDKLEPSKLRVLEISGSSWKNTGFLEYKSFKYPDYDICKDVLNETFDLIIAEQVFEHLTYPYRAGKNVYSMLKENGHFLITIPFMVRVHNYPIDCSRWTEIGLKYFLEECGFNMDHIHTDSWGNRDCVKSNFRRFTKYNKYLHSLKNEPDFPLSVWALAKKV